MRDEVSYLCRTAQCTGGAPGWTRTSGPEIRSLVLYPTELRARDAYRTPNAARLMPPMRHSIEIGRLRPTFPR